MVDANSADWGSEPAAALLDDASVATALDLAIAVALAGSVSRPRLRVPQALRPMLRAKRLSARQQHTVREVLDTDNEFRSRVQAAASADLLDQLAMAWLIRSEGWERVAREFVASIEAEADRAGSLGREQHRRESAERLAAQAQAELVTLRAAAEVHARRHRDDLDRLAVIAAAAEKSKKRIGELEAALSRTERRAVRAESQVAATADEASLAVARAVDAERARDAALIARVRDESNAVPTRPRLVDLDPARGLIKQALEALDVADDARKVGGRAGALASRSKRKPLAVPGGLYGNSDAVAEHYLKTAGIVVFVDGYNVAKLQWPTLDVGQQRAACITAAEGLARKYGTAITLVFDGSTVVGASAPSRRFVHVQFSPEGVLADDVLRDLVAQTPTAVKVLVVTNDQEVLGSVRAAGANTISSDQFLALALR